MLIPVRRPARPSLVNIVRFATLACFLFAAFPAAAVPIGDLHCNDPNGLPLAPYTNGTVVTVTGVLTVGTGTFDLTYTDLYIEDGTGGIEVYQSGITTTYAPGDSMTVTGTIGQFNGNTEIVMTSGTRHATGQPVAEPILQTCAQVTATWQTNSGCGVNVNNGREANEGRLIRINNVTWSGTWPTPGTNGTVTLTDGSGTCAFFIDKDTGVDDIAAPTTAFDIVGILKQYDTSQPLSTGYQIVPRNPNDIIVPGPRILDGPRETNIQSNQVTIVWTTDVPASSRVDWGFSLGYEQGSITIPALVTEHAVTLTGLTKSRIYHYRVLTQAANGIITQTGDELFCSGSGPESSGQIDIFFNKFVDNAYSLGYPAQGLQNLPGRLVERINAADYSIDCCIYSFDLSNVADALIAAHNRGVKVRFVYDNRDGGAYQTQVVRLQAAGITVIDDSYGPLNTGSELMHNKFFIFDHRNGSPDDSDDWVWTGSFNVTSEQAFTDAQNVISIQDAALAEIYTAELNEMWGSSTDTPNQNNSRFGENKTDNTPHLATVKGIPVRTYFSPSDGAMGQIRTEIAKADTSLHFAIFSFTRDDIASDLRGKWYYDPGFELRGVFDSAQNSDPSSVYADMHGTGAEPWDPIADVLLDTEAGSLHSKYMIIDVNKPDHEPTVITGSPNWSNNAAFNNDENMLVVSSFAVANQYFQDFVARYHIAGGMGDLAADVTPIGAAPAEWIRVSPNPTSERLTLRYALPRTAIADAALFAVDGRRVATLFRGELPAGQGSLQFRLDPGAGVRTGVHFLRLDLGDRVLTDRVLIVR